MESHPKGLSRQGAVCHAATHFYCVFKYQWSKHNRKTCCGAAHHALSDEQALREVFGLAQITGMARKHRRLLVASQRSGSRCFGRSAYHQK